MYLICIWKINATADLLFYSFDHRFCATDIIQVLNWSINDIWFRVSMCVCVYKLWCDKQKWFVFVWSMPFHQYNWWKYKILSIYLTKCGCKNLLVPFWKKSNLKMNWKPDAIQSWALFNKKSSNQLHTNFYVYINILTLLFILLFHFNEYIHYFSLSILYASVLFEWKMTLDAMRIWMIQNAPLLLVFDQNTFFVGLSIDPSHWNELFC